MSAKRVSSAPILHVAPALPRRRGANRLRSSPRCWTGLLKDLWQVDLLSSAYKSNASHTPGLRWHSRPPHTGSCWAWLESRSKPSFMAVARKIKTLLTVNILVFVGIILFSVYCRIQDRSEELVQIGRISDQRLRARNGKVSNLVDRQSILQRLERLEDVVYNQLNGRKQLHSVRRSNFG